MKDHNACTSFITGLIRIFVLSVIYILTFYQYAQSTISQAWFELQVWIKQPKAESFRFRIIASGDKRRIEAFSLSKGVESMQEGEGLFDRKPITK